MSKPEWNVTDARSLIDEALTLEYFKPDDEDGQTPIPALFVPGEGPLVLIDGSSSSDGS